jgi:hypothetical protein
VAGEAHLVIPRKPLCQLIKKNRQKQRRFLINALVVILLIKVLISSKVGSHIICVLTETERR